MNDEKRDADAMTFDEVREGDTVRTRQVFDDGTVVESEFPVTYVDTYGYDYVFGNDYNYVRKYDTGRKSLSIELVSRPTAPPKVGDLLTGAQVQSLPDLAVFLSYHGVPRTVFNGMSSGPVFPETSLSFHDFTDPTYRLIYLPEEDN